MSEENAWRGLARQSLPLFEVNIILTRFLHSMNPRFTQSKMVVFLSYRFIYNMKPIFDRAKRVEKSTEMGITSVRSEDNSN